MAQEDRYQRQYWDEMSELKCHTYYVEGYLERTEKWDRGMNMFLAAASSGSIAGWAVWNEYGIVWAIIVAISHVIHAIKGYLPYAQRRKGLSGLGYGLAELMLFAEKMWYDVAEGKLTDDEVHKLRMDLKERKLRVYKQHVASRSLPRRPELMLAAEAEADRYFANFYSEED